MAERDERRDAYRLSPPGRVGRLNGPTRLAINRGTLIGEPMGDRVAVWLLHDNQGRTALMLPGEYTARLDPFELLDEHGEAIARGGQRIAVVGGFLPRDDPRALAYQGGVFCASRLLD
ncbi:MAG TPA: hypothetical protein VMA77_05945 [Solirubrobacteraceae bacterium]|nr:hypothetical protein [Solirubrobacteraceae bacterium]